ncbi:hypothetical protein NE646_13475, partial [Bittarella massiliensis]|nr:hypothetical protein [Bittarella massiliensis (ex Durand et al. 2017)]
NGRRRWRPPPPRRPRCRRPGSRRCRCRRGEEIAVSLPGGQLQVRWGERECYLSGPAETVFCGQLEW